MPFDFDAAVIAPHRMQPGLRKLEAGAPTVSPLAPEHPAFADKLAVLRQHPSQALLCEAGFDPSPALRALAVDAAQHWPQTLAADADGLTAVALSLRVDWDGKTVSLHCRPKGDHRSAQHKACSMSAPSAGLRPARLPWGTRTPGTARRVLKSGLATAPVPHAAAFACLQRLPPAQRVAGLLSLALHEDLALLDGVGTTLPWLAVCLPSHWSPAAKLGRPFAEVHGPVADNATLLAASAHLARLVCGSQRWERFVWTIANDARHDQHPERHPRTPWSDDPAALIASAVWRTKHQRFLPLPDLQHALFSIRVDVQPLAAAIATPQRAAALHAAIGSMSPAMLAYRGMTDARPALLAWLQDRAGHA